MKTRQWDQLLGLLPSREGLMEYGFLTLMMGLTFGPPILLALWAAS